MHRIHNRLTNWKMLLLGCKHNPEPAGCGAREGLTAAQKHLVSEETPPQSQLLLKRRLSEVLPQTENTELTYQAYKNPRTARSKSYLHFNQLRPSKNWNVSHNVSAQLWSLYLSEVSPDIQHSTSVQVRDANTLQLSCQETVSSFQSASVLRQKILVDPL